MIKFLPKTQNPFFVKLALIVSLLSTVYKPAFCIKNSKSSSGGVSTKSNSAQSNTKKKEALAKLKAILDACVIPERSADKKALLKFAQEKNYAELLLDLLEEVARCPDGEYEGKFDLVAYLDERSFKATCGISDFNNPRDVIFAIECPYMVICSDTKKYKYYLSIAKVSSGADYIHYIGFFYDQISPCGVHKTYYRTAAIGPCGESKDEPKLVLHGKYDDPKKGRDFLTVITEYSNRKSESDAIAKKILFQPSTSMPDTGRHVLYDNSYDNLAGDHPSEKQLVTFSYENGNFTFYGIDSIGFYVACKGYPSISHGVQIVPMIDTADATKGPTKEEILKAYVIINGEKVTVQKILQEGLNEEQARMLFDQEQTESGNKTIKIFGGVSKAFRILDPHQLAQINDIVYSERDIPLEGFLALSDLKSLCENRELIKNSEWRSKLRVRVARMCTIKYRFMKHRLSRRILCMDAFLGSPASDKELELIANEMKKIFGYEIFLIKKILKEDGSVFYEINHEPEEILEMR